MTPSSTVSAVSGNLLCVVTDDDALSRQTLENHIAVTPGLVLAGSFADGMHLLDFLHGQPRIDVLFLDVQMPELTGLDVIRLLPTEPAVVLTTAHTDFAVEAFELRVVDYLMKPVPYLRFLQSVARARIRLAGQVALLAPADGAAAARGREAALFVKSNSRLVRIAYADILYVESVNDQAVVVTPDRQVSANQAMRLLANRLPTHQFMRVHRSFIVNRYCVLEVEETTLTVEGGRRVPIGRAYLTDVLASFPIT